MNKEEHIKRLAEFINSRFPGNRVNARLFSSAMPMASRSIESETCDYMPAPKSYPEPSMCDKAEPLRKVKNKAPITSAISSFLSERFEESAVAKKLNYYMHAKDITTAMIYERCYIDRKLISKITNRGNYHPSKSTMLALCIGLQLNRNEAIEFLALAGYSFTNTSKSDLIFEYMITNSIYDLRFINEMLEKYEQPIMGA